MFSKTSPSWVNKTLLRSSFGLALVAMVGCEADLRLEKVEDTLRQPIRRTDQYLAVEVLKDGNAVALASDGVVIKGAVSAAGIAWQREEIKAGEANFIAATDCPDGTVYGLTFGNQVWSLSADGQWQGKAIDTEEQMQALDCSANGDLWVVGTFSTILQSSDQGDSWQDLGLGEDATLTGVAFVDENIGYAVGEFGTLVKTEDGGATWNMEPPMADDLYPLSVYFADADNGWVSGVLGMVLHTGDGGASWERQETSVPSSIYGFVEHAQGFFAYGDQGTLLRLEGDHWERQPAVETPVHFADAVALDDNNLLVVGGFGLIATVPVAGNQVAMANGSAQ